MWILQVVNSKKNYKSFDSEEETYSSVIFILGKVRIFNIRSKILVKHIYVYKFGVYHRKIIDYQSKHYVREKFWSLVFNVESNKPFKCVVPTNNKRRTKGTLYQFPPITEL